MMIKSGLVQMTASSLALMSMGAKAIEDNSSFYNLFGVQESNSGFIDIPMQLVERDENEHASLQAADSTFVDTGLQKDKW